MATAGIVLSSLLTPRLADLLGSGKKTCPEQFRRESRTYQPDITVKRIVISGARATVDLTEGDTDEQWSMLNRMATGGSTASAPPDG